MVMQLALSITGTKMFGRSIAQDYIQSRSDLERNVLLKAPAKIKIPPDTVLRVVKPLFGIPDAVLHWYLKYLSHHIDEVEMKKSRLEPCLLLKTENGQLVGAAVLSGLMKTSDLGTKRY